MPPPWDFPCAFHASCLILFAWSHTSVCINRNSFMSPLTEPARTLTCIELAVTFRGPVLLQPNAFYRNDTALALNAFCLTVWRFLFHSSPSQSLDLSLCMTSQLSVHFYSLQGHSSHTLWQQWPTASVLSTECGKLSTFPHIASNFRY